MKKVPHSVAFLLLLCAVFWAGMQTADAQRERWDAVKLGEFEGEAWFIQHANVRSGMYTSHTPFGGVAVDRNGNVLEVRGNRCQIAEGSRILLRAIGEIP